MTEQSNPDSAAASVLVVDDDETSRYILASWLRRDGHRVTEAADGAQGLALLAAGGADRPELAVVDVNLPDMSGFQVCERIKADPLTAHLPVIHVSATAIEVNDRAQGLYRGADAYLTEPIAPTEFLATVTAALRYARARRRAELLAERIAVLNRVTLDVYGARDGQSFANLAAAGTAALTSAPAAVLTLDPDGREVRAAAVPGAGPRPFGGAAALLGGLADASPLPEGTGTTTAVLTVADWARLTSCEAFAGESEVALILARTSPGRPPVALAVPARVLAGPDDRDLFTQLARTCALALEARRSLREEQDLARTLQRTFLPGRLPAVPGAQLTARYVPAGPGTEIGGDFYEAVETPAGLLLAVGGVTGHSLGAVVVMGELRHALRAYAIEGHEPQAVLERLDTFLLRLHPGVTATACLVLVEPGGRAVRVADAGHLPPVLRDPDGSARPLTGHGPALGLGAGYGPPVGYPAPAGAVLLLFTDGLVGTRGGGLGDGLDALRREVARAPAGLDPLCDHLLDRFGGGRQDDVALLAARLD